MNSPLVSVIIPAFNAQDDLEKAVHSALQQTLLDIEIIIIDDNSTDNTIAVARSLEAGDERVILVCSPTNSGPGSTRNVGIECAKGKWITFLDADDWYEPKRLEALVDAASKMNVNIAADNQKFMLSNSGRCKNLLSEPQDATIEPISIKEYFKRDVISRNSRNLGLLKPLIRKSLLTKHNIRYDENRNVTIGEDFYFLLECLIHEKSLAFLTEPLYNYRIDGASSLTKKLNLGSFIEWKKMHERYFSLFKSKYHDYEKDLMQVRGKEIDRYIEFRRIIEPLKRGQFRGFVKQVMQSPSWAIKLLISDVYKDPSSLLLIFHYIKLKWHS